MVIFQWLHSLVPRPQGLGTRLVASLLETKSPCKDSHADSLKLVASRPVFYHQLNSETAPEHFKSMSTNERHIITLLKSGCLPLKVETGRYRVTKTNTEDLGNLS